MNYQKQMLQKVKEMLGMRQDKELAYALDMRPQNYSKVKRGVLPVGESMLLRLHDLTGLPAKTLREWGGME